MRWTGRRFNAIEVLLFAVLIGASAYVLGRHRTEVRLQPFLSRGAVELGALAERFGSERHSRYGEEWIVRDFFADQKAGVFVDVGANHYERDSNTFFLETRLGWSGLAIEPQRHFAGDYSRYRPATVFVPMFVSDVSNGRATLYVPGNNDLIASASRSFVAAEGGEGIAPTEANTATLDEILEAHRVERIDFLSIDIELHEPEALRGFTIDKYAPRLIAIEAHPQTRQQILDYFHDHGYVVLGKYLRADTENLWFRPRRPPQPVAH